ncbi:Uncharacterised protein [Serratia plymuthica]|nr:Uncharacterised protein [Serratia plymuthica]
MTRYVWNNRLKQRIRFSYWNELCVTGCAEDIYKRPPCRY